MVDNAELSKLKMENNKLQKSNSKLKESNDALNKIHHETQKESIGNPDTTNPGQVEKGTTTSASLRKNKNPTEQNQKLSPLLQSLLEHFIQSTYHT